MRNFVAKVKVRSAQSGVVRAERYDYGTGFSPGIAPHAHEELQLCYSPNGGGSIRTGRAWRESLPGLVYVFSANQEHTAARDAEVVAPATHYVLYIGSQLLDQGSGADRRSHQSKFIASSPDGSQHAVRQFRTVLETIWADPDPSEAEEQACRLLDLIGEYPATPARAPELASRIRDVLLADDLRCASLSTLARAVGATPHQTRAVFKQAYGVPPARYHLLRRLAKARRLLASGMPPANAATAAGFVDQAHLSNRLRRYFGHSPRSVSPH